MRLSDLSRELLELIFRYVRSETSVNTFAHQVCVSKKWRDSFLPVLYRDVVLRTTGEIRHFTQIPSENASLVRSLTLSLSFNPLDFQAPIEEQQQIWQFGSGSTKALWGALGALKKTLNLCTGLVTFSVGVTHPGYGFFLPRPLLAHLVLNLPTSCKNLEIDTNFTDRDLVGEHEPHLCAAIYSLLPQLAHLRLHLKRLCSAVLQGSSGDEEYRTLKSLVVDCCEYAEPAQTKLCDLKNPIMDLASSDNAEGIIAQSLNKLHLGGSFPSATHILVVGRRASDQPVPESGSTEAQWPSFVWRNILAGHNRLIPYHILGFDQNFTSVFTARIRTNPQHDLVASRDVIRKLAKGCFWQLSHQGSRFPAEMLGMASALTPGKDGSVVIPTDMEVDDRNSWREKGNRNSTTLWLWEDTSGVECLTGVVQADVEKDPDSALQQVPAGWREVDSGSGIGSAGNQIERISSQ